MTGPPISAWSPAQGRAREDMDTEANTMRRPGGDQATADPAVLSAPPTIRILRADSGQAYRINVRRVEPSIR